MIGYITNWMDISYYYEGSREGSAYSFGVMTSKAPSIYDWFRFSALIDLTGGMHKNILKLYSKNIVREIDRLIEDDRENGNGRAILLIDDSRIGKKIVNSSGQFQEGEFDGNLSFMKVVEIGDIPRNEQKYKFRHIIGKPEVMNIPHPMTIYKFRKYQDESNIVAERAMEMMNVGY